MGGLEEEKSRWKNWLTRHRRSHGLNSWIDWWIRWTWMGWIFTRWKCSCQMGQIEWLYGLWNSDYPPKRLSDNPLKIADNPYPPDITDTISASASGRISKDPYHILTSDGFGADRIGSDNIRSVFTPSTVHAAIFCSSKHSQVVLPCTLLAWKIHCFSVRLKACSVWCQN